MYIAIGLSTIVVAGAGCTSGGGGPGGGNPSPTPLIPAGIYYVNGGTNPNKVFGLSSAPVAGGGVPSPLPNAPYQATGQNGASGAPYGIAIAGGNILYAVNSNAGSVSWFTINGDNSLTLGSQVSTNGTTPAGICVSPNGKFAAVAETASNEIETFSIGAGGTLTSVNHTTGNGLNAPIDCAFAPDSGAVYVTNSALGGGRSAFAESGAGLLTPIASYPVNPGALQGVAVTSSGVLFAATPGGGGIGEFAVAAGDALLSQGFTATAAGPYGVAVAPNGQSVYVATAGANAVDAYHISGFTLSRLAGAPYQTQVSQSQYVAVSSAGNLLVDLSPISLGVTLFAINGDGTLGYAPLNLYGIPNLPGGSAADGVVVR
ncbi:MAG: beta-propeller fold lactonase family protein [Candidatus Eremiobacteraeota bacterium]|nr:beta-propeller fold lactonase family protein [Candidatus Eremiobacteraeota bacterium]